MVNAAIKIHFVAVSCGSLGLASGATRSGNCGIPALVKCVPRGTPSVPGVPAETGSSQRTETDSASSRRLCFDAPQDRAGKPPRGGCREDRQLLPGGFCDFHSWRTELPDVQTLRRRGPREMLIHSWGWRRSKGENLPSDASEWP